MLPGKKQGDTYSTVRKQNYLTPLGNTTCRHECETNGACEVISLLHCDRANSIIFTIGWSLRIMQDILALGMYHHVDALNTYAWRKPEGVFCW